MGVILYSIPFGLWAILLIFGFLLGHFLGNILMNWLGF